MTRFLPLLNSTNRHSSSPESSKRKCVALAQKAAATCTLSLTSVSVSAHGSSDSPNFIPFPSSPASIPFPSEPLTIPSSPSTSPTKSSSSTLPPRPRVRTQASPLRRKRSTARLIHPCAVPCSSRVESEPDQVPSTPPRKRARKASILSPSTLPPSNSTFHSLSISQPQRKGKASKKVVADLRFLCTVYRSVARMRIQRDFGEATRCMMESGSPDSMDIDMAPLCVSVLDAQEALLMNRLRSYLIFHEINPQSLDIILLPCNPFIQEADMEMDMDVREPNPSPASSGLPPTPTQLPIITQEQVVASLLFRFRQRSKGKSRPEAATASGADVPVQARRRSPLAGPDASWVPGEPST